MDLSKIEKTDSNQTIAHDDNPNISGLNATESLHLYYDSLASDMVTKSAMCVPLLNAEGVVLAVMKLTNRYPSNISSHRPSVNIGQTTEVLNIL